MHDDPRDHGHFGEDAAAVFDQLGEDGFPLNPDWLRLTSVGIDIGSSTSHLMFSKLVMWRRSTEMSSRFEVIYREVLYRSPILLTPYADPDTIDTAKLAGFVKQAYDEAEIAPDAVDTGAVICTGEAVRKHNAAAIIRMLADQGGHFVCATAGPNLEAILGAHGSGAVVRSRRNGPGMNVDVGGGTAKVAIVTDGAVRETMAINVGARLIAWDEASRVMRIEEAGRAIAAACGYDIAVGHVIGEEQKAAIADKLGELLFEALRRRELSPLARDLVIVGPLQHADELTEISFSGGVSEYIYGREKKEFGDIVKMLAPELIGELSTRMSLPILDPGQGIRATVIGASQFTVQVSGKTIYLPDPGVLPVRNVPVVHVGLDLSQDLSSEAIVGAVRSTLSHLDLKPSARMAIAFAWTGDPEYGRLAAAGQALLDAVAPGGKRAEPLLLMIDGDIGKTLGHILHEELGLEGKIVSIDGVQLQELDFVDVGELISPPGVVPVIIKSLLFS